MHKSIRIWGSNQKNTNVTKICQTKTKFNQYNNRTKQNSINCKNKWEIREKGSQTFWIFFFPLLIYWFGMEHANSKKVGQIIRESIRKRGINHAILTLCVWSCREEMEHGGWVDLSYNDFEVFIGKWCGLAGNTIILIPKSRMWTIEGEIHWNWNIQSRVLTLPINKSNIFIQRANDKP